MLLCYPLFPTTTLQFHSPFETFASERIPCCVSTCLSSPPNSGCPLVFSCCCHRLGIFCQQRMMSDFPIVVSPARCASVGVRTVKTTYWGMRSFSCHGDSFWTPQTWWSCTKGQWHAFVLCTDHHALGQVNEGLPLDGVCPFLLTVHRDRLLEWSTNGTHPCVCAHSRSHRGGGG